MLAFCFFFFFSSRRRHTRLQGDWSSDVCSSDLPGDGELITANQQQEKLRHGLNLASLSAASEASAFRSANETSSAAGRAIRTTSYRIPTWRSGEPIPSSVPLATSRRRRRARLRSTEVLIARLTVTPTRHSRAGLGTANPTRARPE